ncbi:unnamed protein product [Gulo gulo]|uniref:Small ribosomal subunit protein uS5 n=1 Tax=Gulo gulo TaxID=48420 RepID=A0A9X9Q0C5_GULGU|nr:unnamed protein product [Gulo gulo]
MLVQKQTHAGQQTGFKAFVAIRDDNEHIGLGHHPGQAFHHLVQQEYWQNKIGKPHIVPCEVTSCCGSVLVCLISNRRGTGIVSASVPRRLLMMTGIEDSYPSARDCTATQGNYAKATFDAIPKTYSCLTPISGKRLCSPSLPIRDSLTIL